jgi:23S rRNA (cytidine1920-2'-O)/16S rRNA (cytidine1409-2'-O)-methyltransferase
MPFVSRAGLKLAHALQHFQLDVAQFVCADLGCSTGGFTDCLLQNGAARVYAVDTGYGVLDWKLRNDPRVAVMERTNAMHVTLPEPVDLVTIDVAWTKQRHILPPAARIMKRDGRVVTLIKPHYEAPPAMLRKGILPEEQLEEVMSKVACDIAECGFNLIETVTSPIKGAKGNTAVVALLCLAPSPLGRGSG